ncbi:PLP-dependent transferase [Haematococcus lacustris]
MGVIAETVANVQNTLLAICPPGLHQPVAHVTSVITRHCEPYFRAEAYEPWELVIVGFLFGVVLLWLRGLAVQAGSAGVVRAGFRVFRSLPGIKSMIDKEKKKMRASLYESRKTIGTPLLQLPQAGMSAEAVLQLATARAAGDVQVEDGCSHMSGSVYIGSSVHRQMLTDVFTMFSTTNPLHADAWPSIRQMEAEVVAMTASMLGGGPSSVCGSVSSGGTESILLAMKASRDWAAAKRGVRQPEIIIARSAHAAYFKAAEYFAMKLVVVQPGKDLRLSGSTVRRALTRNTAVVVASAPCFPHGVVDAVEDIAQVCRRAGVCLHVDACLGGFVLPFAHKLGYPIPGFDFSVPGVTSMSVDTHKFGLAHKGSSVVLYASPELRAHQFTSITDWSGGLYISPTMAGSRPGALIATAWAAMMAMGEEGYLATTRRLMEAATRFREGVQQIPELQVLGHPDMCLVAFAAARKSSVNVYKLKDLMTAKHWSLNALQQPAALHFCFTAAHVNGKTDVVAQLLEDLKEGVKTLVANPEAVSGGSAPMYGMSNVTPDRGMIAEFLVAYQDVMLAP